MKRRGAKENHSKAKDEKKRIMVHPSNKKDKGRLHKSSMRKHTHTHIYILSYLFTVHDLRFAEDDDFLEGRAAVALVHGVVHARVRLGRPHGLPAPLGRVLHAARQQRPLAAVRIALRAGRPHDQIFG